MEVMGEGGMDISAALPKKVDEFTDMGFAYVITVCGEAAEVCSVFTGTVAHRLHMGFADPAGAVGTDEEVLALFRRVSDEIIREFAEFYDDF